MIEWWVHIPPSGTKTFQKHYEGPTAEIPLSNGYFHHTKPAAAGPKNGPLAKPGFPCHEIEKISSNYKRVIRN